MKKILVVDDEVDFSFFLKKSLESGGEFRVEAFNDAKNIVEKVRLFAPDLVLLDLMMPDVGGFEVCEMLNRDPATQAIPIVIISALGGYTDIKRAYNLGVIGYLTKPFDLEQVKKEIQRVLSFKEKE